MLPNISVQHHGMKNELTCPSSKLLINFLSDVKQLYHIWNMILRNERNKYIVIPTGSCLLYYGLWTLYVRAAVLVKYFFLHIRLFVSEVDGDRPCHSAAGEPTPGPQLRAACKYFHLHKNGPKSHFRITEEEWTELPNISHKKNVIYRVLQFTLPWRGMRKCRFSSSILKPRY
jgi:hypothetical protein